MNQELVFPTRMLKACWFTTLQDLGFQTTVSLHNPLPVGGFDAQALHLSLRLFDSDGRHVLSDNEIGVLAPNDRVTLDIDAIHAAHNLSGDVVGVISMTPDEFKNSSEVRTTIAEVAQWTAICDEFVGYTDRRTGTQSGVHYQSPPMNDSRLRSTNTMIVQSPKVVLAQTVESHLLTFAPSSNETFSTSVDLRMVLIDPSGRTIARGTATVPARGRKRVKISDLFDSTEALDRFVDGSGLAMLVGLANGGVVTPLSLVTDQRGGLAIDHTLPPPYYVPWWGGDARKVATNFLINHLFREESDASR